jgi:proline iminopeptidase
MIDGYIPVEGASLYFRAIGEGLPLVVLHGGPDFDHRYLLPELDILADSFRLIYYDQRGRGRSAAGVQAGDVSLESEMEDIEAVRRHFGFKEVAVLGHSWGGLLALEYATRHPERTSHVILIGTAPVSHADYLLLREEWLRRRAPAGNDAMKALAATREFTSGDPETAREYNRHHFRPTVSSPDLLDELLDRFFSGSTSEAILLARAIDDRLLNDTWLRDDYTLIPALQELDIPTMLLYGESDFIPVECSQHIADAVKGARLITIPNCGHFSYCERPALVHQAIATFVEQPNAG